MTVSYQVKTKIQADKATAACDINNDYSLYPSP